MEENNTSREYLDDVVSTAEEKLEDASESVEVMEGFAEDPFSAADSFAEDAYVPETAEPAPGEAETVPELQPVEEPQRDPAELEAERVKIRGYLESALADVDVLNADRDALQIAKDEQKKTEKELNALQDALEKEKNETITMRRLELEASYVKQVRALETEVKRTTEKRQKARAQGVKARIEEQTAANRGQIGELMKQLAALCKEKGLPSICTKKYFYTLFCPKGNSDYLKSGLLLVIILVVSLLFGFGISKNPWARAFVVVFVLLICLAVYTFILNRTKAKNPEAVKEGRGIIDEVLKNEQEIKAITDSINNDKSDDLYNLQEFDEELAKKNGEIDSLNAQKAEALEQFDTVTQNVLREEIEDRFKDKIAAAQETLTRLASDISDYTVKVADGEQKMNTDYMQYIGGRNLTHEKLESLIGIVDSGEVQSLQDAITRLNTKQ